MYQEKYFHGWVSDANGDVVRNMKHKTFIRQLDQLGMMISGRILDVGCATGFFLEVATKKGWDAYGVELSEFAAVIARQTFGSRVFHGTVTCAGYPDGFFDAVMLSDVIEHLADPHEFMTEIGRVVRPGGIVMAVTPNAASLSARLMGRRWSHYNREHLLYFTMDTMTRLLDYHGFQMVSRGNAPKYLNIFYVCHQLGKYAGFLGSSCLKLVEAALPERLKRFDISLNCGEMYVIARRLELG
jgi:SAM-dependent methyltransferase